ncbi:hypothetical protein L7F22_031986 [Adiantum nelumboides]|nr:hypothetical protein [Adiantum nelumboides]
MDAKLSSCAGRPILYDTEKKDVWANFPLDLQEQILAFLPAAKLLELQGLCSAWRQLIRSPRFIERWQSIRSSRGPCADVLDAWMMRSHEGSLVIYIPMLRKCAPFSSFIPALPLMSFSKSCRYFLNSKTLRLRLLGGTAQFLFFEKVNTWERELTVFDTITGQTKNVRRPYDRESYSQ